MYNRIISGLINNEVSIVKQNKKKIKEFIEYSIYDELVCSCDRFQEVSNKFGICRIYNNENDSLERQVEYNKTGKVLLDVDYSSNIGEDVLLYAYNQKGQLLSLTHTVSELEVHTIITVEYDKQDRIIKTIERNKFGDIIEEYDVIYNKNNNVSEILYTYGKQITKHVFEYVMVNNNLIREIKVYKGLQSDDFIKRTLFYYDPNTELVNEIVVEDNINNRENSTTYEYNDKGLISKIEDINYTHTYEYNEHGLLISHTEKIRETNVLGYTTFSVDVETYKYIKK